MSSPSSHGLGPEYGKRSARKDGRRDPRLGEFLIVLFILTGGADTLRLASHESLVVALCQIGIIDGEASNGFGNIGAAAAIPGN